MITITVSFIVSALTSVGIHYLLDRATAVKTAVEAEVTKVEAKL